MSVTMQPRNLPVVEPVAVPELAAVADELAALAAGLLAALLALDELLPHAAMSKAVAPAATVTANEVCFTLFPPLNKILDAQVWQGRPEHRLPGDYFVNVSGGNRHACLEQGCNEIATRGDRWLGGCQCETFSALLFG
ncbi:MAG TPA: hypothetical protein VHV09_06275 [Trebonia sp.]|nr:hypothetical protein [Trebonia sp.]